MSFCCSYRLFIIISSLFSINLIAKTNLKIFKRKSLITSLSLSSYSPCPFLHSIASSSLFLRLFILYYFTLPFSILSRPSFSMSSFHPTLCLFSLLHICNPLLSLLPFIYCISHSTIPPFLDQVETGIGKRGLGEGRR